MTELFGVFMTVRLSMLAWIFSTFIGASAVAYVGPQAFPIGPNPQMTPGSLCQNPTQIRYPERIKYCQRNVDRSVKQAIIAEYDRRFGFQIQRMDRQLFKIDHYIPLCAGGSNDPSNLWPQHQSVFVITDPLEQLVCQKMQEGRLRQVDAIAIFQRAKNNLQEVPRIYAYVNGL